MGDVSGEVVKDWLKARGIITAALNEWFPQLTQDDAERYADAIQARLAGERLIVVDADSMKGVPSLAA
jgi:hypothetical protein